VQCLDCTTIPLAFLDIIQQTAGIIQVTITWHYLKCFYFYPKLNSNSAFGCLHVSPPITGDQGVKPHGSKMKNMNSNCKADTLQQMAAQKYSKCAILKSQLNVFMY
jgi:hypothetical protein